MAIARPSRPYPDLSWSGWGDPALAMTLPDSMLKLLADGLGVHAPGRAAGALTDYTLPPEPSARRGDGPSERASSEPTTLDASAEARIRHMRGKSTPDLLAAAVP